MISERLKFVYPTHRRRAWVPRVDRISRLPVIVTASITDPAPDS